MFQMPIKTLIVNSDDQVQCLEDDGTPYADGDIGTDGVGGFILQGFLTDILNENNLVGTKSTQLRKIARAASVQGVATFTVTSTSASVGDSFSIQLNSLDKADVQLGQQKRYFKRYQIGDVAAGGLDTAAKIAAEIRTAINADTHAEVVASGASTAVILTPKAGISIVNPKFYSSVLLGTTAITTPGAVGNGNYENLINEEWNIAGKDYLRNIEELPVKGTQYSQWDFTMQGTSLISGYGGQIPNQIEGQTMGIGTGQVAGTNPSGNYNFRLYVATGTALETALDLVDGDLNARA